MTHAAEWRHKVAVRGIFIALTGSVVLSIWVVSDLEDQGVSPEIAATIATLVVIVAAGVGWVRGKPIAGKGDGAHEGVWVVALLAGAGGIAAARLSPGVHAVVFGMFAAVSAGTLGRCIREVHRLREIEK